SVRAKGRQPACGRFLGARASLPAYGGAEGDLGSRPTTNQREPPRSDVRGLGDFFLFVEIVRRVSRRHVAGADDEVAEVLGRAARGGGRTWAARRPTSS